MIDSRSQQAIVELNACDLSRVIQQRQLSCREVMQAYLAQIETFNPQVNALVALRPASELLKQADEHDRLLARGEWRGWMHGMPLAVKDLAQVRDLPTSMGSPLFAGRPASQDAISVARMRASGAIFIGRSNVPEFGLGSQSYNRVYGVTRNAWDRRLCAGGSSGGAAVSLALRMLPVADGSDMMGSLRNPAAFNNVYGLRPSQGRVPGGPAADCFIQQLATEGPMARSVADLAHLLAVQSGYDPRAPLSLTGDFSPEATLEREMNGLRIGWLGDMAGHLPMETAVKTACEAALDDLRALGCAVEPCRVNYDPERLWQCWLTHRHWLVSGQLGALWQDPASRAQLKPEAVWEVENGMALTAQALYQAGVARGEWHQALLERFMDYDYLVIPSTQVMPFDAELHWPRAIEGRAMDTYHRWMEVTIGPSLAGLPAASIPAGFSADGLPVGLQIIGPPRGDLAVLQLARAHERAFPLARRLPPMLVKEDDGH
jgi:amidase